MKRVPCHKPDGRLFFATGGRSSHTSDRRCFRLNIKDGSLLDDFDVGTAPKEVWPEYGQPRDRLRSPQLASVSDIVSHDLFDRAKGVTKRI